MTKAVDMLLIYPPFHQRAGGSSFLPLGLGYLLSSIKEAGFSVSIIDCTQICKSLFNEDLESLKKHLKANLREYSPSLIGIGPCVTSHFRSLQVIADVCKSVFPETTIVGGGPLASMQDQEWVFFDELNIPLIIKGDGEMALPALLETMKNGLCPIACPKVSYEGRVVQNIIDDLDSIAFPARSASEEKIISSRRRGSSTGVESFPMITSRGCINSCDYCVSGSLNLPYRKRTNENIAQEMVYLRDRFGAKDIIFYDDCFFSNPDTSDRDVEDFCSLLLAERIDLTWQIEIRTDLLLALSDSSIKLLEKAGCRQLNLGIEKTRDHSLRAIGKTTRTSSLKRKNGRIKELSNIKLAATFILGGPGEDEFVIRRQIEESKDLNLDQAHYNPLFIYPSTNLYKRLGFGHRDWVQMILDSDLPWGEIVFETSFLTANELTRLTEEVAYAEFYGTCDNHYVNRFNLRG